MKKIVCACLILPFSICGVTSTLAEEGWGDQLSSMVTDGKVSVDFRYRYEGVDEEGFTQDAQASTLRTRLTLASAKLNGFAALLEMDDVHTVGPDGRAAPRAGRGTA